MTTILYTGWDTPYHGLARLTMPLMNEYAAKHKMDAVGFTHPPKGLNIYWTGVARGLELLKQGYDRIMYLDVDQMVTNMEGSYDNLPLSGFHVSKDWGEDAKEEWHFSMCGFIAHEDCIPLFHKVLSMEPDYRDKPFQEQAPMQAAVHEMLALQYYGSTSVSMPSVFIHPRKLFNCVPDAVCPGKVPEPWQKGDFAAHLTMLPVEKRIELFHQIKASL